MDFNLTEEQQLIQESAREFATKMIAPLAHQIDVEDKVPGEILDGMAELGFMGIPFEEKYGGSGLGYEYYVLVQEQISRFSSAVGTVFTVHMLGADAIVIFGTEEQKDKYFPRICNGELHPSFAFTEPETGSDPKQLATTVTYDGDFAVINGTKRFISAAAYEGPMVVFCKDPEAGGGVSAYIVDKFCPGYSLSPPWEKIGGHGSPVYDVYLRDVRVPVSNLLGQRGQGFDILLLGIAFGKIGTSAIALGGILAAYEEALKYAKEKLHRGKPIAKFQAIQLKIGHLAAKYHSTRWMCYRLGVLANDILSKRSSNWGKFEAEAALVKGYASDTAVEAARLSMDVHASYGLTKDFPIERIYRDVIICPQIEGVSDMQRIIFANSVLG
ncbi:MAG: acyl-CoA dehydrogenase [Syntrophomonadaceae bacterium]|nr:acyl-CoA dehydrogenase [Syntrophomonadaceae bacterium]